MVQKTRPNLSWLFLLVSIACFCLFGMESNDYLIKDRAYELDELREEFGTILEMQPEFINLDSTESQYKAANGIYKLIPYYQKLSPDLFPADLKSSRFIIHKHVITGQWQLTDVYSYPCSRNIKAFPVTDENEKMKFKTNLCIPLYQTVQRQEIIIETLQKKVKTKDDTIKFLTTQNEILLDTSISSTIKDTTAYVMYHGKLKIQNELIKMYREKMKLMQTEMNFQKNTIEK